MGRRIEVELTSTRDDGSWTWRAAGAKQPKGELSGDLLYGGAKVGDVVKVEADFHLDGIEVVEVFPPKAKKERGDLLELKTRPLRDDELVTTQRVSRRDRGDRGRRGDRPGRSDRGDRGDRGDRRDRRSGSGRHEPRPDRPQRPKPKRLRPKREHRDALLASVPEEHRPIVEQVVRDGMPGVRTAIEKQNAEAKEAGKPEIDAAPILAIAERHLAAARLAEWRDRADAALATIDDLDLRDLRSVVVVGNDVARDDESRAQAEKLKAALDERMETDHGQWLSDLRSAVSDGRVVRALRLSSRPVKAGAPLPTELAGELSRQAAAALAPDVDKGRWAIVLDALAFSPVRGAVTPTGVPTEPGEELLNEVRRLSDRIPTIAGLFGIDPAQVPRRAKRRGPNRSGGPGQNRKDKGGRSESKSKQTSGDRSKTDAKSAAPTPTDEKPTAEKPKDEKPSDDTTEVASTPTDEKPTDEKLMKETAEAAPTPAAEKPKDEEPSDDVSVAETGESAAVVDGDQSPREDTAEVSPVGEPSSEPEAVVEPEATSDPAATEPEVPSEPEITSEPVATSDPAATEPEVPSEPEATSEPEITSETEATSDPAATEPEVPSEPEAAVVPETAPDAEATADVESGTEDPGGDSGGDHSKQE